ncbi:MAG: DMT family transporter [Gemmatimonadaceae bacterium]
MRLRDLAILFLLAALWGGSFLFIRIAAPELGAFPLALGRVSLAAPLLLAWMKWQRTRVDLRPYAGRLLILGALNAAIPFSLIGAAELHVTASLAAMLNATVPLWALVFSVIWLGERVNLKRGIGLLLGVVGVAVLVGWSPVEMNRITVLSIVAILIACASYGLNGVFTRMKLGGVPAPALALGQQLGAMVWLTLPAAWQFGSIHATRPAVYSVIALGVLCTAIAYPLYFHLIAAVGPMKTTTVTYLLPMFGSAWGAIFLGETVTRGMMVGMGIVLSSVILVNEVKVGALVRRVVRA